MSSPPKFIELSRQKATRPSFSPKCSMLSQYLKEKGNFVDLTLRMRTSITADAPTNAANEMLHHPPLANSAVTTTTMTLFPLSKGSHASCCHHMGILPPTSHQQPMNLFPQKAGFSDSRPPRPLPIEDDFHEEQLQPSPNKPGPTTSQLTIFYGGQVIMFNDFPIDKAHEVMHIASKGSCSSHNTVNSHPLFKTRLNVSPQFTLSKTSTDSPTSSVAFHTSAVITSFSNSIMIQEQIHGEGATKMIACDPPIARRASLHRFLEKRKDRITARAPYQQTNGLFSPPKSMLGTADSNTTWLGLASQSPQQQ